MAPVEGERPNAKNVPAATDYTSGAADRVHVRCRGPCFQPLALSSRDALLTFGTHKLCLIEPALERIVCRLERSVPLTQSDAFGALLLLRRQQLLHFAPSDVDLGTFCGPTPATSTTGGTSWLVPSGPASLQRDKDRRVVRGVAMTAVGF